MNKIIPIFKPLEIILKCAPCLVVSTVMFIHHKKAHVIVIVLNTTKFFLMPFENLHMRYDTMFHEIMALMIGHGLGVIM